MGYGGVGFAMSLCVRPYLSKVHGCRGQYSGVHALNPIDGTLVIQDSTLV